MGKKEIWDYWTGHGYSEKATAAIMGCIGIESGFRSNNVEDAKSSLTDVEYTRRVDDGSISRYEFSHDSLGYGYYQHTWWTRKEGLYDLCKSRKKSIADETCQHDWARTELHQDEYMRVLKMLKSDASLFEMTQEFMLWFEKPKDQSAGAIDKYFKSAQTVYNEFVGKETYWPPRVLQKGDKGPDVSVAQSILIARGYDLTIDGDFGRKTEDAVVAFKTAEGLSKPTILGNKAWARLLRR